jgi:hypothetical protein
VAGRSLLLGSLASAAVRAELESARRDWEVAYRRLREESRDPAKADALHSQLEAVSAELRKRVGGTYTLDELAREYVRADDWARSAVAENAPTAGWPGTLSIVEGAAFLLYSRGAVDYEP